jgi:hypothetical protein
MSLLPAEKIFQRRRVRPEIMWVMQASYRRVRHTLGGGCLLVHAWLVLVSVRTRRKLHHVRVDMVALLQVPGNKRIQHTAERDGQ